MQGANQFTTIASTIGIYSAKASVFSRFSTSETSNAHSRPRSRRTPDRKRRGQCLRPCRLHRRRSSCCCIALAFVIVTPTPIIWKRSRLFWRGRLTMNFDRRCLQLLDHRVSFMLSLFLGLYSREAKTYSASSYPVVSGLSPLAVTSS